MAKTVRPRDYIDVYYVGHYFCEGNVVVMDLTTVTGVDATPFVDFAAGLVVGQGGAMERLAPRVFVLVPPGKLGSRAARHPVASGA